MIDENDIEVIDGAIVISEIEVIPLQAASVPRATRVNPFACKKKRFPLFVVSITALNWLLYFYGIIFVISWANAHITASHPLSPPIKSWYFYTVTGWPHCDDARDDRGRIFTYQFVHASLLHLGGNSIAALTYGAIFDMYSASGFWGTLSVYFISIYMGGLGHSAIWPFKGLVGCSPGVYGLIGGCWVMVIFHRERLDHIVQFILPVVLVVQFAGDVLIYVWMYSTSVGYASHFFGFYSGVMVSLTFLLWESPRDDKLRQGFGVVGLVGFVLLAVFLLDHYTSSWPPQAVTYPFLNNVNFTTCCAQLFRTADARDISVDVVKGLSYCHNNHLYWYGS